MVGYPWRDFMKTLIIIECGHNWNGDIKLARQMIRVAKKCGGDIAKFQLYDTDKLGIKEMYGQEVYDDLKLSELTKEQLVELKNECDKVGIEFLASVFDTKRVDWTEELGMNRYKIASRSITDRPLIDKICETGKNIIASLGMWPHAFFPRIETKANVDFLYCVSNYPTELDDLRLPDFYRTEFSGFSDHTIGIDAALVAVSRGARIIEKHFTLDRKMPGYDQKGSIEPKELREMIKKIRTIEKILY